MKLTFDQALRKAATLALKGRKDEAAELYRAVLRRKPDHPRAIDGLRALSPDERDERTVEEPPHPETPGGELPQDEAERLIALAHGSDPQAALDHALALLPRYGDTVLVHSAAGVARAQLGRFEDAIGSFGALLQLAPDDAVSLRNRGNCLRNLGRLEEAIPDFARALRIDPAMADAAVAKGNCEKDLDRFDDALASFDIALRLDPEQAHVWYNRGNALVELKRADEALASYERTIALDPGFAEAHNNRGNLLREAGLIDAALASFDAAIRCKPDLGSAHNNRAVLLKDMKRLEEALEASDLAVEHTPDFNAHNNRGVILTELKRFDEALISFDAAVRLKPESSIAYNNAGNVLQDMERYEEAIACYNAAIDVAPDLVDAYGNRANAFGKLDRPVEAIASYADALRRMPDLAGAAAHMLYQMAQICDWSEPELPVDLMTLGIEGQAAGPFTLLALDGDPGRQLARARNWTTTMLPPAAPPLPRPGPRPAKLRIGYFSADYHDHATMLLMARVFELHDRDRFELHAFSYGPDKRDWMQERAAAAFDHFHDVRHLTDAAVAALSRELGIAVAADLKGYTRDTRSGIFAHRAAPVQISYIGYPGSMGADFIDYIVADTVVVPPDARRFYDEKIIALPGSYQANDNSRPISPKVFTRAELGLPEAGFVFCCFNNNYKIAPDAFNVWMRLLGKVEGSVLWLLEGNRWARANLAREAEARGIDPARLVFAPRMVSPEHLARHRCADLFLDTFNYNAHTTGSDALWAGLPIVTLLGESFASRVGGSLLHAVGLDELVTRSAEEYEALALALANAPARLAAIRAKLAAQLAQAPLFDTARFTRAMECAYDLAYARAAAGLPPDHIDLAKADCEAAA